MNPAPAPAGAGFLHRWTGFATLASSQNAARMNEPRTIIHLVVSGRVQGVGFRAWVEHEARRRGLNGWVRNRRDGTVEAVFAGAPQAVDDMVARCRAGPRSAAVTEVEVRDGTAADLALSGTDGFAQLPTV